MERARGASSKRDYQRFAQVQQDVYRRATFGWAYWMLKNVNNQPLEHAVDDPERVHHVEEQLAEQRRNFAGAGVGRCMRRWKEEGQSRMLF